MSDLVVITFDNPDEALKVRESLRKMENEGYLSLNDSAIVVKEADGKVHLKNEMDRGTKVGAVGGSMIGLLIGSIMFPIAGLVLGALGGGLVGHLVDKGVDQKFVKDVTEKMTPGSSAIFFIIRGDDPGPAIATLRQYKGEIYQTTLPEEAEEALRDALKKRAS
jgi:uncharacterized membrane protein